MNCHVLHLQAVQELQLCLIRTPLLPELRRWIVRLAQHQLDDLDWAPQVIVKKMRAGLVKVLLEAGWIAYTDDGGWGDTCYFPNHITDLSSQWIYSSHVEYLRRIARLRGSASPVN